MIACEAGAQTHGPLFCAPDQRLEVAALNSSAKKGVDIDERSGETEGTGGTPPFESHVVAFNGTLSSVSQAFVYVSHTLRQLAPQLQVWFLFWFKPLPRWSREQGLTA